MPGLLITTLYESQRRCLKAINLSDEQEYCKNKIK